MAPFSVCSILTSFIQARPVFSLCGKIGNTMTTMGYRWQMAFVGCKFVLIIYKVPYSIDELWNIREECIKAIVRSRQKLKQND